MASMGPSRTAVGRSETGSTNGSALTGRLDARVAGARGRAESEGSDAPGGVSVAAFPRADIAVDSSTVSDQRISNPRAARPVRSIPARHGQLRR